MRATILTLQHFALTHSARSELISPFHQYTGDFPALRDRRGGRAKSYAAVTLAQKITASESASSVSWAVSWSSNLASSSLIWSESLSIPLEVSQPQGVLVAAGERLARLLAR